MLCFHFFVARLMATTTIEPDSDLEQMRAWIERFKEDEEEEVRLSLLVLTGEGILGHVVPPWWSISRRGRIVMGSQYLAPRAVAMTVPRIGEPMK